MRLRAPSKSFSNDPLAPIHCIKLAKKRYIATILLHQFDVNPIYLIKFERKKKQKRPTQKINK